MRPSTSLTGQILIKAGGRPIPCAVLVLGIKAGAPRDPIPNTPSLSAMLSAFVHTAVITVTYKAKALLNTLGLTMGLTPKLSGDLDESTVLAWCGGEQHLYAIAQNISVRIAGVVRSSWMPN